MCEYWCDFSKQSLEMSTGVPPRVPPGAYSAEPLDREPRKYTYFRRLHSEFAFGIFHLSSYTKCCPNDNIQYGVWHFRERFVNYHLLCVILMKKSIRYSCWYICLFFSGQNVITLFNALDYDWTHVWGHWIFHKSRGVKCQWMINIWNECSEILLLNPLRAKFLRENINIYLHFMSFLHTDKTQVVEIPPRVRQGPAYST